MSTDKIVPEAKAMRETLYTMAEDACRYRLLKARYIGADFSQPSATGQGTRCVLIFDWPERAEVSKSLNDTVDRIDD